MESYTFAQAEQLTGTTRKALRNRVYRGQLESVLRGGVRRIPRSELERVGLLGGDDETGEVPGMPREPSRETPMMDELLTRLERQAGELGELRVLTREADSLRSERERLLGELHETRAQVTELEARLAEVQRPRRWWRRHADAEASTAA